MRTYTSSDVVQAVRDLAGEHPDRTAQGMYLRYGQPECLIGAALTRCGITVEQLHTLGREGASQALSKLDIPIGSIRDHVWLISAQFCQDYQIPWSAAVELTDQFLAEKDFAPGGTIELLNLRLMIIAWKNAHPTTRAPQSASLDTELQHILNKSLIPA